MAEVYDFNAHRRKRAISRGRVPLDSSYIPTQSEDDLFAYRIERIRQNLERVRQILEKDKLDE